MCAQQSFYSIAERSQIGEARRRISELAVRLGFTPTATEKVAIVVTELATNLLKHAGEGELVVRTLAMPEADGVPTGIEILALDRGPGMANVAECLSDGYSTAGSLGQGLGAIQRQATTFNLYSAPGLGTALLVQLWAHPPQPHVVVSPFVHGAACRPKPGEQVNGDAWTAYSGPDRNVLLLCDGLGHGSEAAAVAQKALHTFDAQPTRSALAHVEAIHDALRSTRGAAVAVAEMAGAALHFAGLGNISGRIQLAGKTHHLLSQSGIAGHRAHKIQAFRQPWAKGALLILHSDGLGTRWSLDAYPGLSYRHPSLIAGVLYRDFRRGTDDVTVVVVKEE